MNKWSALRPYLFFVVLALAVGGAAGAAARAGMDAYDLLTKPPATPPDWLFPVVWTLLYLLMGIAMGRVWRAASGARAGRQPHSGASSSASTVFGRWCFSCGRRTARHFSCSQG